MTEIDFSNVCDSKTFTKIIENLQYYEARNNTEAIRIFRDLREKGIKECGIIVRSLDKKLYTQKFRKETQVNQMKNLGFERMLTEAIGNPKPIQRKFPINLNEEYINYLFPEICDPSCKYRTCPYHDTPNYGHPCKHRYGNYENEQWWQEFKETIAPPNPNESLLR